MGPDCGTAMIGGIGSRVRQPRAARLRRPGRRFRHRPAGDQQPRARAGRRRVTRHRHRGAGPGCGSRRDHLPAGPGPAGPRSRDGGDRPGLEATRSVTWPGPFSPPRGHREAGRGAFRGILAPGAAAGLPLLRHEPGGSRLDGGRVVEVRRWSQDASHRDAREGESAPRLPARPVLRRHAGLRVAPRSQELPGSAALQHEGRHGPVPGDRVAQPRLTRFSTWGRTSTRSAACTR